MPLPPSRPRSSARSRLLCWRVVSGASVLPVNGPMLPLLPDMPAPGCGKPTSGPVRARGSVLPAPTSLVEGEIEPAGAAAAPAGPAPVVAEPAAPGAAGPAAPAAPRGAAPGGAPPPGGPPPQALG